MSHFRCLESPRGRVDFTQGYGQHPAVRWKANVLTKAEQIPGCLQSDRLRVCLSLDQRYFQRDVESSHRVCECSARNECHAGASDFRCGCKCDVSGSFCLQSASDTRHRTPQQAHIHTTCFALSVRPSASKPVSVSCCIDEASPFTTSHPSRHHKKLTCH